MKKEQVEQMFQEMEKQIRNTIAAIKNNEVYLLSTYTREIRLDILFNRRAISISLEKGDVNQTIDFTKRLSQGLPNNHVVLYLSTRSDRQDRIVYDSDELIRHRVFYPRMVRVRPDKREENNENY